MDNLPVHGTQLGTPIDLELLWMFAEHSERLDEVEKILRERQHTELANYLLKLQQDMGLEIEWQVIGREDEPPGPNTALLWGQYEPVTVERLQPLKKIAKILRDAGLHSELLGTLDQVPQLPTTTEFPLLLMDRNLTND